MVKPKAWGFLYIYYIYNICVCMGDSAIGAIWGYMGLYGAISSESDIMEYKAKTLHKFSR